MSIGYGPRIVTEGLVLALDAADRNSYPGSGTTWTDLSGRGNNGTLVNGVGYNGSNGGSLSFDGTNGYVNLGNKSSLQPQNITVSAWFNRNTNPISGNETIVEHDKAPWISYGILIGANSLIWHIGYTNSPPYSVSISSSGNYLDNKWHNVVGTYDKQNLKIYVDGIFINQLAFTSNIIYSSANFQIGYHFESNTYFENRISNVFVYNRALTAAEVQQNFNATRSRFGI